MGGIFYVGLNHVAIESDMNMRSIKKQHRLKLCNDLLVIEHEALKVLNKKD